MYTSSPSPKMPYFQDNIRFVHRSNTDYTISVLIYYQMRALSGGLKKRSFQVWSSVSSIQENRLIKGKCAEKSKGKEFCHFVETIRSIFSFIYRLQLVYLPKQTSAKEGTGNLVYSSNLSFLWNYSTISAMIHLYFLFVKHKEPHLFLMSLQQVSISPFKTRSCNVNQLKNVEYYIRLD